MKIKSLLLLIILGLVLPLSAVSQDQKQTGSEAKKSSQETKKAKDEPLKLDQILAKYYNAIGGLEKWQKLNTMVMQGTMNSQGQTLPILAYHKRPNLCRVEFRVKETMMAQIFNGYFAWQINPLSGNPEPAPMTNGKTKYLRDTCGIENSLIDYKTKGYNVKLLGEEKVNGKNKYKIRVKYKSGNIEIYYIDAKTYLITKSTGLYDFDGQETRISTQYNDYKNTKGYMVPYQLVVDIHGAPGQEILNIDTFAFNIDIDSNIFEFPKENLYKSPKKEKQDKTQ